MKIIDLLPQFKRYALIERGLTPKTLLGITSTLKNLCEVAGTDDIHRLTTGVVREFLSDGCERRGWSPKTFHIYWQNIRSFFVWCVKRRFVKSNPTDGIERPKLPEHKPRFITTEQFEKVLATLAIYPWHYRIEEPRNLAIIAMFTYAGLRLGELRNLESTDIDLDEGLVVVRDGKGRKERHIPLSPRLRIVLRRYIREKSRLLGRTRWFFPTVRSDMRLTDKNVWAICGKISQASGVKFTPHMLRHTFARMAINDNVNLYAIKEAMRQASVPPLATSATAVARRAGD